MQRLDNSMQRHVRAVSVVHVLADKGAAMREEDRISLARLKAAYVIAT